MNSKIADLEGSSNISICFTQKILLAKMSQLDLAAHSCYLWILGLWKVENKQIKQQK